MITFDAAAKEVGKTIKVISKADYNFDTYGHGLVVSDKYISENPELITKFLRASYKGLDYAIKNKMETVDIMMQ